jgi:hypothetical protein
MRIKKGTIIARESIDNEKVAKEDIIHTGVYVGKEGWFGEPKVIHFTDRDGGIVEKITLSEFAAGEDVFVLKSENGELLIPETEEEGEKIVNKAKGILHDPHNKYNGNYNPVFLNCQDFTEECWNAREE